MLISLYSLQFDMKQVKQTKFLFFNSTHCRLEVSWFLMQGYLNTLDTCSHTHTHMHTLYVSLSMCKQIIRNTHSYRHDKGQEEVFLRGQKCEYKRLLQQKLAEKRWREKVIVKL